MEAAEMREVSSRADCPENNRTYPASLVQGHHEAMLATMRNRFRAALAIN
jgi:hypothetical protein